MIHQFLTSWQQHSCLYARVFGGAVEKKQGKGNRCASCRNAGRGVERGVPSVLGKVVAVVVWLRLEKQFKIKGALWQTDHSNGHDSLRSKNGYPTEQPVRLPIVEHVGVPRLRELKCGRQSGMIEAD